MCESQTTVTRIPELVLWITCYIHEDTAVVYNRGAHIPDSRPPRRLNFVRYGLIFVGIHSMELASYQPSGGYNPEFSPVCLKNVYTPSLKERQ
jgi:hypothetical protein